MFVNTMLETRRFGFIANVYLSGSRDRRDKAGQAEHPDRHDRHLPHHAPQPKYSTETGGDNQTGPAQPDGTDGYGLVDDDGDG